jgi:hypothetical protein
MFTFHQQNKIILKFNNNTLIIDKILNKMALTQIILKRHTVLQKAMAELRNNERGSLLVM